MDQQIIPFMKIDNLIEIYMNEKSSKLFLEYKKDVFDYFYNKLTNQKRDLDKNIAKENNIIKNLYELEIERISYILKEYLVVRCNKMKQDLSIDKNLMSNDEIIFYDKFKNLLPYKKNCDEKSHIVGFICKKNIGTVVLDEEPIEMSKDDFFVGPAHDISELIRDESIFLV